MMWVTCLCVPDSDIVRGCIAHRPQSPVCVCVCVCVGGGGSFFGRVRARARQKMRTLSSRCTSEPMLNEISRINNEKHEDRGAKLDSVGRFHEKSNHAIALGSRFDARIQSRKTHRRQSRVHPRHDATPQGI